MPTLPAATQKNDSILVSTTGQNEVSEEIYTTGGKWEDEEERKFYEEVQDLKDFVPKSVLGIEEGEIQPNEEDQEKIKDREAREKEEMRKLEEELEKLSAQEPGSSNKEINGSAEEEEEWVFHIL